MKRPPGVIVSAVILLLLSLWQLATAVDIVISAITRGLGSVQYGTTSAAAVLTPVFMILTCGFLAALAIWGIPTAVGLLRMRRWARDSVVVLGGAWLIFGLLSFIVRRAMLPVPGFTYLYPIMCALGVSWLVYFNLTKVREQFQRAPGKIDQSGRPLLISAMAVIFAIRALLWSVSAFLPGPGVFFTIILHGSQKIAVHLVIAALMGAAAFGLWRLLEWGRLTALALQAFGLAQSCVSLVWPSLMTRNIGRVNPTINVAHAHLMATLHQMLYNVSFAMGVLFLVVIVWILHHYRAAFQRPTTALQTASPHLP